jgi:subtilisin family serine protease
VNSWSTFNRASEFPAGDYSNNPNHLFNLKVTEAVEAGVDVVFAAGNCGQFCPDPRCGRNDRGPGSSIFGANSHPRVLTVGAVRSDGLWVGYSSQGEGQPNLAKEKPDLCAASEFHETDDAGMIATGTSAATALAAGVIAVLRQQWPATIISPDRLKAILIATAHQPAGTGWNERLGYGILDANAAFEKALIEGAV